MNDNKCDQLNNEQTEKYGETMVKLMVVGPYKLYVYWEIGIDDFPDLKCQLLDKTQNNKYILRVYDVSNITFDGNNAHYYFDVDIDEGKEKCYIDLWSAGSSFCVELGIKVDNKRFLPLLCSNIVHTPKVAHAEFSDPIWMKVETSEGDTNPRSNKLKKANSIKSISVCNEGKHLNVLERREIRPIDERLSLEQVNSVIEIAKNWDQIISNVNDSERKVFIKNIDKVLNNPKHYFGFSIPQEILESRNFFNFSSMSSIDK